MTERWAVIPGHPWYEVSDRGRVRSLRTRRRNNQLLTTRIGTDGYVTVTLYGQSKTVHRLMMAAFVGPPEGRVVRHLDGDPLNCSLANLAYGTIAENAADTLRHGKHHNANKTHCKNGHPYDEANTYVHKAGRVCRTCNRLAQQRRQARLKATP